jgi:2-(1,2-epoxy-1,2-dihydrophenyl)acetyl-CoA isomerase
MPSVLVSLDAGVLTVTLNRPDKLNAFNPEMHQLLREALARAADEAQVRVVVLTGAGRAFCSGQDLSERNVSPGAAPIDLSVSLGSNYNPLVRRMRELPKPILCALNGTAAGAGANVALACDVVFAARSARLVGLARAMGLALFAEKLSAEDAERIGLIWKVLDDDQLMPEVMRIARELAAGPTKGYGLVKKALYASGGNTLDAQLELERDLQREAGFSEDYREGVAAFLQKRTPLFKGK